MSLNRSEKKREKETKITGRKQRRRFNRYIAAVLAAVVLASGIDGGLLQTYAGEAQASGHMGNAASESESGVSASDASGTGAADSEGGTGSAEETQQDEKSTAAGQGAAVTASIAPSAAQTAAPKDEQVATVNETTESRTMALSLLKNELEEIQTRATNTAAYSMGQYASESVLVNLNSGTTTVSFTGGSLVKGENDAIPGYSGLPAREFAYAGMVYEGAEDEPIKITSLYPHEVGNGTYEWYYTSDESDQVSTSGGALNSVEVAYKLPERTTVRLYYSITSTTPYNITNSIDAAYNSTVTSSLQETSGVTRAVEGEWVTVELNLPSTYRRVVVQVSGSATSKRFGLAAREDDKTGVVVDGWATLRDETLRRYEFQFQMPAENVTLTISETSSWTDTDGDDLIWGGVYVDEDIFETVYSHGVIRLYNRSNIWAGNGAGPYYPQMYPSGSSLSGIGVTEFGREVQFMAKYGGNGGSPHSLVQSVRYRNGSNVNEIYSVNRGEANVAADSSGLGRAPAYISHTATDREYVPVSDFKAGETVVYSLEASLLVRTSIQQQFYPETIAFDVYPESQTYNSKQFNRVYLELPKGEGQEIIYGDKPGELPTGGRIRITCDSYDSYDTQVSWHNGNSAKINLLSLCNMSKLSDSIRATGFKYSIWVEGVANDYKLVVDNSNVNRSRSYVLEETSGIDTAFTADSANNANVSLNSFAEYYNSYPSGTLVTSNMSLGSQTWFHVPADSVLGYGYSNPYVKFYIKPLEGFALPTIATTYKSNETIINTLDPHQEGEVTYDAEKGAYVYQYVFGGDGGISGNKENINGVMGRFTIKADPIKFAIRYRGANSVEDANTGADVTLAYNERENYVIQPQSLEEGSSSQAAAFTMKLVTGDGAEEIATISYADYQNAVSGAAEGETRTYWTPGDLINVRDFYNYVYGQGYLKDSISEYHIRLVEDSDSNEGYLVDGAKFDLRAQKARLGSSALDNDADPAQGQDVVKNWEVYKSYFYQETRSQSAYEGTTVVLGNYPERFTGSALGSSGGQNQGNLKYILDETHSKFSGTVAADTTIAWLYYWVAANVELIAPADSGSTLTSAISTWNTNNKDTWYIGENLTVGDNTVSHLVDLNAIKTALTPASAGSDDPEISGWKLLYDEDGGGTVTADEVLYTVSNSDLTDGKLDLTKLTGYGEDDATEVWSQIFAQGTIYLMPTYESTKPITLSEDGQMTGNVQQVELSAKADGNGSYTLTSTFYMEGAVPSDSTASYAVYVQGDGVDSWGLTEKGSVDLNTPGTPDRTTTSNGYLQNAALNVAVDPTASGNTKITLTFSGISDPGPSHTDWRFYMWNEANGSLAISSAGSSYNDTAALEAVFTPTLYACQKNELIRYYPFTTASGNYTYADGENNVTISTGGADGKAQLQATFYYTGKWEDYVSKQTRLTLYRTGKNAAGDTDVNEKWVDFTGGLPNVTGNTPVDVTVTRTAGAAANYMEETARLTVNRTMASGVETGGSFTLTFTLLNGTNNRLRYAWEDATSPSARIWYVYAWNESNANGDFANVNAGSTTSSTAPLPTVSNGAQIPRVGNKIHITPTKVNSSASELHVTEQKNDIKEGETFTITARFNVDPYYPIELQLGQEVSYGDDTDKADGRMHWALMKQNPMTGETDQNTNPWNVWIYDASVANGGISSGENKVSSSAQPVGDSGTGALRNASQVSVTFTVKNIGTTMSWYWENNANYEAFGWNLANNSALAEVDLPTTGNTAINAAANQLKTLLTPAVGSTAAGAAYANVPSLRTEISLMWREARTYVFIPQVVSLTEDNAKVAGDTSGTTYVGGEVNVSYEPLEAGESTHPVIDVEVDEAVVMDGDAGGTMTAYVYDTSGAPIVALGDTSTQVKVGTLSSPTSGPAGSTTTFSFWLNAPKPDSDEDKTYIGNQTYTFTLRDYVRP